MEKEVAVLIVGAGPAGLAAAASPSAHSIPHLILEKDDCVAPLWRKRTYDCLHLHLPNRLCQLPGCPHPATAPTFLSKHAFLRYLDAYAEKFGLRPLLRREVGSAAFDEAAGTWRVVARNLESGKEEEYVARYLVVASGENGEEVVPRFPGMESFGGTVVHSSGYRSGEAYGGKDVLVVGSGNSGMEIAFDLCKSGARTSIVVKSRLHLVTREIWSWGQFLTRFLSMDVVDALMLFMCRLKFGDTSMHGIHRPSKGPMYLKMNTPVYPVMDTGTFQKIKSGEIQVLPSVTEINGNNIMFADGKGDENLIGDDGMCRQKYPNHWKGKNGLYCTGLVRRGLYGCAEDALNIAEDINRLMQRKP